MNVATSIFRDIAISELETTMAAGLVLVGVPGFEPGSIAPKELI